MFMCRKSSWTRCPYISVMCRSGTQIKTSKAGIFSPKSSSAGADPLEKKIESQTKWKVTVSWCNLHTACVCVWLLMAYAQRHVFSFFLLFFYHVQEALQISAVT